MIKISFETMERAINKALTEEHNFARRVAQNTYIVECRRGHEHLVRIEGDEASCDCEAGKFNRYACHHMAAALSLHLAITENRIGRRVAASRAETTERKPSALKVEIKLRSGRHYYGPYAV